MPRTRSTGLILGLFLLPWLALSNAAGQTFQERVEVDEAAYLASKVTITGRILDETGRPIKNALIKLYAWGENATNNGRKALSNVNGRFILKDLDRRAALIKVGRKGYYNEVVPVDLQRPASSSRFFVGNLKLYKKRSGRVRLIFGGDTMIGRRFIDKDADGDWGETQDIVRRDSIANDSKALFKFVRQTLTSDDHSVINLETPVTDNPITPHPGKSYSFYTRTQSADGLSVVGIDSVSLGNNHVYDYLEAGLNDTLLTLNSSPIRWFGAGVDDTRARASRMRINLNNIRFSMQGFSQLTESQHGSVALEIVAHDSPNEKGGALALNDQTLQGFVDSESGNRFTIPVIHGGSEYASSQTDTMRAYFKQAIERGADLVVAHHPHVAHGVSYYNAGRGPRWIFGSLGNFVFDQDVYESFRSYLTMVDVQNTAAGPRVKRVQLLPYRIDNYSPRFLTGDGLTRMARYIGHLSTRENERQDGIAGAKVFEQKGRVYAAVAPHYYKVDTTTSTAALNISSGQSALFEFLPQKPAESLSGLQASRPVYCALGRDIGVLGSFEEQDVDDAYNEGDVWQQTDSRFLQSSVVRTGRGAMAIVRAEEDSERASTWLGNKVRVVADEKLTLTGFVKAQNAGDFVVSVRWMSGSDTLSQEDEYTSLAGSHDWQRIAVELTVPANADGIKIYYRQYPPSSGEGLIFMDDLALVTWQPDQLTTDASTVIATPNDWRFVRCNDSIDGSVNLTMTRDTYSIK